MHLSFFPAFFDHPARMRFAQQEEDEHIELFLRQHFITNIPWIALAFLAATLPIILLSQNQVLSWIASFGVPREILLSFLILWYLFILTFVINRFLYWYFNIYIVTNKHLVDIGFHNLLSRNIIEVRLDDVQSASSKIQGIIRSLFNFGDVIIESAAKQQVVQFLAIPRPDFVTDRIQDLQEAEEGLGGGDVG